MPPPTPQQQQQRRRRSSPSPPPPPPPQPQQQQPPPPPLPPPQHDQTPSATKRKRGDDGAVDPREVTDAEVEEFYAILRRVHCAAPRPRRSPAAVWSPAFAWEDFAVGDGTLTASVAAEKDAAPRALDLNADPEEAEGDRGGDEN